MKAFLLIETTEGKAKEVTTALKQLHEVKSVNAVTGPYDVLAICVCARCNKPWGAPGSPAICPHCGKVSFAIAVQR